jgi:aryl-alcohol dehydrogenase-like predicted oxidoreductase
MEYRLLGGSGFKVPVLTLGTGNFGGASESAWGTIDQAKATRMVDFCIESGVTCFDTADIYTGGHSEETLGSAIKGRRDKVLISTKGSQASGPGPNDRGASRFHITQAVESSLRRLCTDYIDLYELHSFDALTPPEESLYTLNELVRAGKIRYIGCSNYPGWFLMKCLAISDRYGWPRMVAHQAFYSLVGRDYEWDLMPLGIDQKIGCVAWSPLGWGRLTGKIRRNVPKPTVSRLNDQSAIDYGPPIPDAYLHDVVDAVDAVAAETGKTVPQIALNWLLSRPTVSTIIIGARDEAQLRQNLGALGWKLTPEQIAKLDKASARTLPYPHWHANPYRDRVPLPV